MTEPTEDHRQIEASRKILRQSEARAEAYEVEICGLAFIVLPGVFSPEYFGSTRIFSRAFPYRKDEDLLEIGSGTGATSVLAGLHGARRVLAVDINPNAVENTRANALRHGVLGRVETRLSDIYSNINVDERFDTIYWNLPFIYTNPDYLYRSVLERSLFDPGYRYMRTFLEQAPGLLRSRGRIIVGYGDFGDLDVLQALVAEYAYEIREVIREEGAEGDRVEFILYELTTR